MLLALAASACLAAGANLAAHRPYQSVTPPNYWGWKGPVHGDKGQLTDGQITETWSRGAGKDFYALPSVAGWSSVDPVVIVFDLGEERAIGGLGLHTVLSPWGPWWPAEIAVLVSDNGADYTIAAQSLKPALTDFTPPVTPEAVQAAIDRVMADKGLAPTTHWWRTDELRARGRYVSLIMTPQPSTGTIDLDEIEIYEGDSNLPQIPRPGRVLREGRGGWQSYLLAHAIDDRLSRDIDGLAQKIAASSLAPATREQLQTRLQRLDQQRADMPVPAAAEFRAVFPINELHREVFAAQAAFWRAQGAPNLRAWQAHRWDPLEQLQEPTTGKPRIRIVMGMNEVRSGVLNLTNAGESEAVVRLTPGDLPSLDVFEVLTVDTRTREPVTAAMIPAARDQEAYRIRVPAGMTRQVWLRCSSRDLKPRKYAGAIRLSPVRAASSREQADTPAIAIPATIEVLPVRLPDRLTLNVGGWDYAIDQSYQVTAQNRDAFVAMLREYGVNVPWSSESVLPHGTYDAEGNLTAAPSRERMNQWLAMWPDANCYCVVSHGAGVPLDAPHRANKITAWAADWASYLQTRGISPDRLAILLCDEPTSEAELKLILDTGRAIKQGAPEIKIFNDIHFADPNKAPPLLDEVMRETCDIQCFNRQHYQSQPEANDAFMARYGRPDLQWWTYTAGATDRRTDPYVGWLLQEWFCFDKRLAGSHFWAFGDSRGGFSWNEYLNPGSAYTPLYLAPDAVTTAKYMEALREGMQDYELLLMLRRELERRGASGSTQVTRARRLLDEGVRKALAVDDKEHWAWSISKDRSTADQVREDVLRALRALAVSAP